MEGLGAIVREEYDAVRMKKPLVCREKPKKIGSEWEIAQTTGPSISPLLFSGAASDDQTMALARFLFPKSICVIPSGVGRAFFLYGPSDSFRCTAAAGYTGSMMDEQEFRRVTEAALEALKKHLYHREEESDAQFEVEEQGGVLNVLFEEPPGKFVITANAPVRQIWISALSTSFKLDWDAAKKAFVLLKSGETLEPLVDRLIDERLEG